MAEKKKRNRKTKRRIQAMQRLTGERYQVCLEEYYANGTCEAIEYEFDRWKALGPESRLAGKGQDKGMTFEEMRKWEP